MPLPDPGPGLRGPPHSGSGPDVEGIEKLLQVHVGADGAKLAWAVRIDGDQAPRLGIPAITSPDLGEGNEESLLWGETVNDFSLGGIFGQRPFQGFEGDAGTAEISDILTQSQFSVDVQSG